MPTYPYRCSENHVTELFLTLSKYQSAVPCQACGRPSQRIFTPTIINGGMITDATRKLLEAPFGRERAQGFRTVSDVDKSLKEFESKHGRHMGQSGKVSDDR